MTDAEKAARYKAGLEAIASLEGVYQINAGQLITIAKELLKER
ncbi:hypothetical protein [Amphritea sp. HPY]